MNMPLLSLRIQHPSNTELTTTLEFPGLTAFYNRKEGTPVSRLCAVIFGDFTTILRDFGGPDGDVGDAVALYTALELFDDPRLFSNPVRIMRSAIIELTAMIKFKRWVVTQKKGALLGLDRELTLLAAHRKQQKKPHVTR